MLLLVNNNNNNDNYNLTKPYNKLHIALISSLCTIVKYQNSAHTVTRWVRRSSNLK